MTWTLVSSDVAMFSGYCVTLVTATDLPNCSFIFSFVLKVLSLCYGEEHDAIFQISSSHSYVLKLNVWRLLLLSFCIHAIVCLCVHVVSCELYDCGNQVHREWQLPVAR